MENAGVGVSPEKPGGHRRNRSAVLKSIITPQSRKRSPTKGARDESNPLGEIQQNAQQYSPRKGRDTEYASAVSNITGIGHAWSPKKPKQVENSFSPSRQSESIEHRPNSSKENTEPSTPSDSSFSAPIWAQFASQAPPVTLSVKDEISRYTPRDEFTSKQRTFGENPALGTRYNAEKRENPPHSGLYHERQTRLGGHARGQSVDSTSIATKRGSRVMAAVAMFNGNSKPKDKDLKPEMDPKDLDAAFEAVLISRNIPENQRPAMRSLDVRIKSDFVRNNSSELATVDPIPTSTTSPLKRTLSRGRSKSKTRVPIEDDNTAADDQASPSKRSRSRGRAFTFGKRDASTSKQQRSNSRPRSFTLHKNSSTTSLISLRGCDGANDSKETLVSVSTAPEDFVAYLKSTPRPQDVEIGRIHKLRLLLRNETVYWVDQFISKQGFSELINLLTRVMEVEWREEHEDILLHEVLRCLKGLCTTKIALEKLSSAAPTLFPRLLKMLFDEERKGPSEFNTRGVIISLLFAHLSSANNTTHQATRAREILSYLSDPAPAEEAKPLPFIQQMHRARPYQIWKREVVNVSKEVFWIFLHRLNIIPLPENSFDAPEYNYTARHFPLPLPPEPAAPYVGGVEWDATHYIYTHLELLNGLLASLPTKAERNTIRSELCASGFEECMGGALRTCKEKFYGCVHAGLKAWVSAAIEDGWDVETVRYGPKKEEDGDDNGSRAGAGCFGSPSKSPKKGGSGGAPPKLELPVLQLQTNEKDDGWL